MIEEVVKNKKASKPRNVFFASFSDTEKEAGCGGKTELRVPNDTNPFFN